MKRKICSIVMVLLIAMSIGVIVYASSDSDSGTITSGVNAQTSASLNYGSGYYYATGSASISGPDVAYVYYGDGVNGTAGCSYDYNSSALYNSKRTVTFSKRYSSKPYKAYGTVSGYGNVVSSEAY